jgi:hypothetical protein
LVGSLIAGFDAIANHIDLVLIPVLFDLFLWFGPHLRMVRLMEGLIDQLFTQPGMEASQTNELIRISTEFWKEVAQRFNLFTLLRSYPIGVPSLLAASQPVSNPLGLPISLDLGAIWQAVLLWVIFSLVGIAVGTLYFSTISQAAISGRVSWQTAFHRWPWEAGQTLLLTLSWFIFLLVLSIPASCLISTILLTGMNLSGFALFIFVAIGIWILFPLFFSPHGIFANHSPIKVSIQDSLRITRLSLPKTALFVGAVLLIDEGFTLLWQMPAENSWLALIGVIGHAFIVTGLIAASFVYYRDAARWQLRLTQQAQLASHL